jgi:hypothetical protein
VFPHFFLFIYFILKSIGFVSFEFVNALIFNELYALYPDKLETDEYKINPYTFSYFFITRYFNSVVPAFLIPCLIFGGQ